MTISKEQTLLFKDLKRVRREIEFMDIERKEQLDAIATLLESLKESSSRLPTKEDLERMRSTIQNSITAISNVSKEVEILRSLSFSAMEDREGKIAEAHSTTFEWVYKSHELSLSDPRSRIELGRWLRSGEGIFWVSGKAGSGKSTFMKWLYNEDRTSAELQEWANGSELATASFYFWNTGTDMQKSQRGLLQSLLYELLSKDAQLIPILCKERWHSKKPSQKSTWSCAELTAALRHLSTSTPANKKFCFFIDGLDEYNGDHLDLIEIMSQATESPHIKICLSSRPWNCFEDAFGTDSRQKLYLQDLTREDIEIYTKAKLTMPTYLPPNAKDRASYQRLISDIVERAQGVFLWVYLVVVSLRNGLVNGDNLSMLETRLHSLPTDLEKYFEHILASVELIHKEKVGSMFLAAVEANEPLLLLEYSFIDEDDPDFAIDLDINPMDFQEVIYRQELMRRRINWRSKGLLEVNDTPDDAPDDVEKRVDFLHKSVRDFLRVKEIERKLGEMATPNFNASRAISRALLASFKADIFGPASTSDMMTDRITLFSQRAEALDSIADHAMMEELERVCKSEAAHMFCSGDLSFLMYAVRRGLVCFVASTLERDPELATIYGSDFLAAALYMPNLKGFYAVDLAPMVQMLLKKGVSPNIQRKDSQLLWTIWLEKFPLSNMDSTYFDYWGKLLKILLLGGARAQDSTLFFNKIRSRTANNTITKTIVDAADMLLSHGLRPNEPNGHGQTFWTAFLEHLCTEEVLPIRPDPGMVRLLIRVFSKFLHYGADPTSFVYDNTEADEHRIRLKGTGLVDGRFLCWGVKEAEEEIDRFIKLLKHKKSYYEDRKITQIAA